MKRVSFLRTTLIVSALLVAGWTALSACSNQGEGERCELGNGDDECKDGLICTAAVQLPLGFNSSDRCCPVDRSQSTTEECRVGTTGPVDGSAPSGETGPPVSQDSGSEASDAASEAADAAEDG